MNKHPSYTCNNLIVHMHKLTSVVTTALVPALHTPLPPLPVPPTTERGQRQGINIQQHKGIESKKLSTMPIHILHGNGFYTALLTSTARRVCGEARQVPVRIVALPSRVIEPVD